MKNKLGILFVVLTVIASCDKQDNENPEKKDNPEYIWSDGLYFNGLIDNNRLFISDTILNKIGTFGETNLKWGNDSIYKRYGIQFDFNNGFSLSINYELIASKKDFDTVSGCYKYFDKLLNKGEQLFLYDYRLKPKNGFYFLYFKRDLRQDTIYYLPVIYNFQDSIDFGFKITDINFDNDTAFSRVTQKILFDGIMNCRLVNSNWDTIKIIDSRFKAKFDQIYYLK